MLLIAYTRPEFYPGEAEELTALLDHVDGLHIRKEAHGNEQAWRTLLEQLPEDQLSKVWIHQHYNLCADFRLGGVHITRRAKAKNKALGIFAALHGALASISVRTPEEAKVADELYDRLIICPVFPSISKPDHQPIQPIEVWKAFLDQPREAEAIALGGIGPQNIQKLKTIGFDGAAVLGSLWNPNRVTGHRSMVTLVEDLRTACRPTTTY